MEAFAPKFEKAKFLRAGMNISFVSRSPFFEYFQLMTTYLKKATLSISTTNFFKRYFMRAIVFFIYDSS